MRMNEKKKSLNHNYVRKLFETNLKNIVNTAQESKNEKEFKEKLKEYIEKYSNQGITTPSAKFISRLIEFDSKEVYELSRNETITIQTISLLWQFLKNNSEKYLSVAALLDLYNQFINISNNNVIHPTKSEVIKWMKRWPSGLNPKIKQNREANKNLFISELIKKIELQKNSNSIFKFPAEASTEKKRELVNKWWDDYRFQLTMAIRSVTELNKLLGNSLSQETKTLYRKAKEKGMPFFITPYYLSLLDTSGQTFDDIAIRSYILYSKELVETFGNIHAWEREDIVKPGKPNAAGWLLPAGHNIHRRYPEVAILIPDSMGRACGGLCASCQRMYDFQSKRLNFDLEELKATESWDKKLHRLMNYFEKDTQLRDVLITGGDALMSQNRTLAKILEQVYLMAKRKNLANESRPNGEKFASIQRVRLGTRLPVYLPMRVDKSLVKILKDFRNKAIEIGIRQFVIQTHFQSPLEVTPASKKAIKLLLSAGWTVTNQLVYNVAASRRGHTAKLRKVLNNIGVITYYTFSVKGFEENHAVFTPNSRSVQEEKEEKILGIIQRTEIDSFVKEYRKSNNKIEFIKDFRDKNNIPFIASDRNVLNLPGIGKSMTFKSIGIDIDGKRILEFEHDHTRHHSPIIETMEKIYIKENKSLYEYIQQLKAMGEKEKEYQSLWLYNEGKTEKRFQLYEYPNKEENITKEYSNLVLSDSK